MRTLTALFILSCFASLNAQTTFGTQQVITTSADAIGRVYATDLDSDCLPYSRFIVNFNLCGAGATASCSVP